MFDHTGGASCCHLQHQDRYQCHTVLRMKALDGSENLGFTETSAQVTWGLTVPEVSSICPALSPWYIHLLHQRCGACSVQMLMQLGQRG